MPLSRNAREEPGQGVRHRDLTTGAERASVASHAGMHVRLPFVVGPLGTLPPGLESRAPADVTGGAPPVFRRVPLARQRRIKGSDRVRHRASPSRAEGTTGSPRPIPHRNPPLVIRARRASPPDRPIGPARHVAWAQTPVARRVPFLHEIGAPGCQRVGDADPLVRAEGALAHPNPVLHRRPPLVVGSRGTAPPHLPVRTADNIDRVKASVLGRVPLACDLWISPCKRVVAAHPLAGTVRAATTGGPAADDGLPDMIGRLPAVPPDLLVRIDGDLIWAQRAVQVRLPLLRERGSQGRKRVGRRDASAGAERTAARSHTMTDLELPDVVRCPGAAPPSYKAGSRVGLHLVGREIAVQGRVPRGGDIRVALCEGFPRGWLRLCERLRHFAASAYWFRSRGSRTRASSPQLRIQGRTSAKFSMSNARRTPPPGSANSLCDLCQTRAST